MSKSIAVAACQIEVVADDREGNLGRVAAALELAVAQKADLAVFPESAVLGWINPVAHEMAHAIPGEDSDRLCALARQAGLAMIIGLDEKSGDQLFGAAIAISSQGKLLAKHRKANVLPELMNPPYEAGPPHCATVAEFDFGRVAILICADSFVDETVEAVRILKPDLLAVPYGWVAEPGHWPEHGDRLRALVSDLASRLACPVVGVDAIGEVAAGPWKDRRFCGASVMANRSGEIVAQATLGSPSTFTMQLTVR